MARRAQNAVSTITVTVAEMTAYKERILELKVLLDDAHRENQRLRDELDAQDTDAIAVAHVLDDLDHALAFGFTDRVADILASNPYNMLTRNMIQIAFTA